MTQGTTSKRLNLNNPTRQCGGGRTALGGIASRKDATGPPERSLRVEGYGCGYVFSGSVLQPVARILVFSALESAHFGAKNGIVSAPMQLAGGWGSKKVVLIDACLLTNYKQ